MIMAVDMTWFHFPQMTASIQICSVSQKTPTCRWLYWSSQTMEHCVCCMF